MSTNVLVVINTDRLSQLQERYPSGFLTLIADRIHHGRDDKSIDVLPESLRDEYDELVHYGVRIPVISHSDSASLVAVHDTTAWVIAHGMPRPTSSATELELLKALADRMGYNVVKKDKNASSKA